MTDEGELALYRAIVGSMTDGVGVLRESDGVVLWANGRLASLLGRESGGLHGRPASQFLEDGDEVQSTARSSPRTESVVRDDGTSVRCRITIRRLEHPDYGMVRLVIASPLGAEVDSAGEAPPVKRSASVMRGITLPARGTFHDDLTRELARAQRSNAPLSVALLSLDGERDFTDPGMLDLLADATQAWRGALRDSDSIAYYDFGEFEYVLLLPDCSAKEAAMVTERARGATPEACTCSAGFATWNRSEAGLELAARAHMALRKAQRGGGDRSVGAGRGDP